MQASSRSALLAWLILGDAVTLGLVTLFGFGFHREAGEWKRMLTTFAPLFGAWLLLGPHLGVFDPERLSDPRQLWRPFWAMVLCAPLAAWLRGVWLGTPVQPVFVVVLGGISALALLVWRLVYYIFTRNKGISHG